MNSLSEPLIGLLFYDRLRAGLHRIGGAIATPTSTTSSSTASSTSAASPSVSSPSSKSSPKSTPTSTKAKALVLRLDEPAFREFAAACRLAEAGLAPDDIRGCSALRLDGGRGQRRHHHQQQLQHSRRGQQHLLAIRLDDPRLGAQARRGLQTSASVSSVSEEQPPQQHRYTGIGKRAGHQQQQHRPAASALGRIFGGQSSESPPIGSSSFRLQQQHQHDDAAGSSAASASMQNLLRSVSRDIPLDSHAQSAVLLRLVDAYTRGVRDGIGAGGGGGGSTGSLGIVGGGKASDRQRRLSETAWNFFWGVLKAASIVGVIYLLVAVLNPRDSLSKVMLTDISVQKETSKVRFADVRGCDTAKKELEDVVSFLKHPDDFQRIGARLPRGVLLVGPPGVGKTMLAKAVAGEAEVPFFQCSGSQFDEVFVGTGAARVRRLFEEAKKAAPCVIFIDEFDSVGGKRVTTTHHPYANQTVNQLLAEMDGFSTQDGIIVLAATNRPEILDNAVTRPGRFDVSVQVQLPDLAGRRSILELYLSKVSILDDVDVDRLAKITIGFSGAQLANVVNQAAVIAALEHESSISWSHVQTAYNKVKMGTVGNKPRTAQVNAMTAAHESGHTIVALFTKNAPKVNHVTILPRGLSLGHTAPLPDEADQYGKKKCQLLAQIDMFMGGQVAEELLFGADSVTTGCSDDLRQATSIARMMVEKLGMSDAVGVMTVSQDEASQQTLALADAEVKRLLDDSRDRVRRLVREHRPELERLTGALLDAESLDYDDILRVVAGQRPLRVRLPAASATAARADDERSDAKDSAATSGWLTNLLGGTGGAAGGGVGQARPEAGGAKQPQPPAQSSS